MSLQYEPVREKERSLCEALGTSLKINYPIPKYYQVIIGCYEIIWAGYYKGTPL
jgi:hypothetical protein